MNGSHSDSELLDDGAPLPLLPATLHAFPLSSSANRLYPPLRPAATSARLSPAEDRFRSDLPPSVFRESAQVARGASRLLEALSPGPPSGGGTEPPATATPGPKAPPGASCKQQLSFGSKAFRC